jgi:hypothetical protein
MRAMYEYKNSMIADRLRSFSKSYPIKNIDMSIQHKNPVRNIRNFISTPAALISM